MNRQGSELFIVDNSDTDWKVSSYLKECCELSRQIDIATGYFEIGAFLSLGEGWNKVDKIRILMGDEVFEEYQARLPGRPRKNQRPA